MSVPKGELLKVLIRMEEFMQERDGSDWDVDVLAGAFENAFLETQEDLAKLIGYHDAYSALLGSKAPPSVEEYSELFTQPKSEEEQEPKDKPAAKE